MPDVTVSSVVFFFGAADAAVRMFMVITGIAVAAHYHLMANFMGRAPHLVKALALPCLTASGVGMVACSISGATEMGLLFGTMASGLMVAVNVAAWAAGAYVSEQFERAAEVRAQIRRDGWAFVRGFDQLAETARVLSTDPKAAEKEHAHDAADR